MILSIRNNAATMNDLRVVWAGIAPMRPELPDNDRIRLLEESLARLLAIEARHEGDGK